MIERIRKMMNDHQAEPITQQKQYAVLIPLVNVDGEMHMLFEVRSHRVSQPGETSFPGGAVEAGETFLEAAVRETEEELRIDRKDIHVLGEMDYIVKQSHIIKCYVGWLPDTDIAQLKPNGEVEEIFTLPLEYFLTHEPRYYDIRLNMERDENFPFELISGGDKYKWRSVRQQIPFYHLTEHYLWGYTAHFTHRFSEVVREKAKESGPQGKGE